MRRLVPLLVLAAALAGCGGATSGVAQGDLGGGTSQGPGVPIGRGAAFQPSARSAAVDAGRTVRGLACEATSGERVGVHLELFAAGRVVIVPAGLGIAPPARREGAYVRGGRCHYPVRTTEPTGVLEVAHGTRATLGDLFALWGRRLDARHLLGFGGRVRAYVGGEPYPGDPRTIPLTRHAQLVLAVGPRVPVHRTFTFRPGL